MTATLKDNKEYKIKNWILWACIGRKGRETYETLTFDSKDDELKFCPTHKLKRQNFQDFITELKRLSTACEFENLQDSFIKGVILCGANDKAFCERFPRESDLTLLRAISAGHSAKENRKRAPEILQFQSTTDLYKKNKLHKPFLDDVWKSKEKFNKCKLGNVTIPGENAQHMESGV